MPPMQEKPCRTCRLVKPRSEFYLGGTAADCRACYAARVRERYREKIDERRAYERRRAKDPERREKRKLYAKTAKERDPARRAARTAVGNALRDGRLLRQPCEACGAVRAEAHHDDYARPLDVRWLCFRCHRAHHDSA